MTTRRGTPKGGYWFHAAVRSSDLPPLARSLAWCLAGIADNETGQATVSLSVLTKFTGMSRASVAKHLNLLEAAGFVERDRPPAWKARSEHAMTVYVLHIPAGYQTHTLPSYASKLSTGLVRDTDMASAAGGLGLVRESDKASPSRGHRSTDLRAGPLADAAPPPPRQPHDPPRPTPRHDYQPDGSDLSCAQCGMPEGNAAHREAG